MKEILEGLLIIAKYDPDTEFTTTHDQIFSGDYEKTYNQMTDDEKAKMEQLGWFESEESWSYST